MVKYENLCNGAFFNYKGVCYKKLQGLVACDLRKSLIQFKAGAMVTPVSKTEALVERRKLIERRKKIDEILSNKK